MSASTEKKLRQAAREAGTDKKLLAAEREAAEKAKSKRRWTLGTVLVVLLIAAILFLNSGFLFKGTTAMTVGDESYSPAELNYHYANQFYTWANMYGSYASIFGLDTSMGLAGLESQECSMLDDGGTWADYFMTMTKDSLQQIEALTAYAKENGIELSAEELAEAEAAISDLESYAAQTGFASADNFLDANYGKGVTLDIALEAARDFALANKAANAYMDSLEYTAEELEEKYASYNGDNDYFDLVYHYIAAEEVLPEGETAEDAVGAVTEETLADAKAVAEAVAASFEASGETDTEARFNAALAENGIEATAIHNGNMAGSSLASFNFAEWATAERAEGDITVIENASATGYYVLAYVGRNDNHYPLAQVRHILIKAVADENGEYTDEAKAEALARAEEIYAQWQAGEATEESFAALANELSEDTGSNTNGGLYDNVMKGQMVEEFDAFCFAGHKSGDTGIVYGEAAGSYAGYHVMYYVGEGQLASDYIAESDLVNTASQEWITALKEGYPTAEKYFIRLVG